MTNRTLPVNVALWRFGFRQTRKGALILGILIAGILAIQGQGYHAAYPDETARLQFAASMKEAPALGILYGEPDNLISSTGYMVYRVVPVFGLVAAIWSLSMMTKLLRGQEEDGRWEQIVAGATTAQKATRQLYLGFMTALLASLGVSTIITFLSCQSIGLSLTSSLLINTAVFLPAFIFGSLGVFTSQLSISRRRAMLYGLVPLLIFFALRSLGNAINDLYWLKHFTPFGWAELTNPIVSPQLGWLIPSVVVCGLIVAFALQVTSRRDIKAGLIKESSTVTSRFYLLGSARGFALRENIGSFIGWGIATIAVSGIIAAVASVAAKSLADSESFSAIMAQIGGSFDDLKLAFIGTGLIFTVVILLLMATQGMGAIRNTEAKQYLDTLLTQPLRRSSWLTSRLITIVAAFTFVSLICAIATWFMARGQGISIELTAFLLVSISLTGTVIFTLGIGTLIYGLLPRITTLVMYCIIAWSFLVDIIGSIIELPDIIVRSSLLHYISVSPNQSPDWQSFLWLVVLGLSMMTIGIVAFTKRDIISE